MLPWNFEAFRRFLAFDIIQHVPRLFLDVADVQGNVGINLVFRSDNATRKRKQRGGMQAEKFSCHGKFFLSRSKT